jgi:hypothetical protein
VGRHARKSREEVSAQHPEVSGHAVTVTVTVTAVTAVAELGAEQELPSGEAAPSQPARSAS